jgi:hypothetical protein
VRARLSVVRCCSLAHVPGRSGSVEFVATKDYVMRPIQDPCFVFVIDVSYTSVVTGLLATVVESVRDTLDHLLAAVPRARVGFVTYHSTVQFYSLRKGQPQVRRSPAGARGLSSARTRARTADVCSGGPRRGLPAQAAPGEGRPCGRALRAVLR